MLPAINTKLVCVYVHKDEDGVGDSPEKHTITTPDLRSNKPYGIHDQSDGQTAFFQTLIEGNIFGKEVSVAIPNEISLSLSIAQKSLRAATTLRDQLSENTSLESLLYKGDVSAVYDLLEEMQKAVVFSYRATEAFCNASIPSEYCYRKTTQKGITEEYGKEQIERWITTSEKVSDILPEVLNCESPKQETFWSDFKKLESLRNDVIHSKSSSSAKTLSELLSKDCAKYVRSSSLLLQYFIKVDPTNQIFPLGFGDSTLLVTSVKNADDYIAITSDENPDKPDS